MSGLPLLAVTCTTCTRTIVHWDPDELDGWLLWHTATSRAPADVCPATDRRWQRKDAWAEVLQETAPTPARELFPISFIAWGITRSVPLDVPPV